MNKVLDFFRKFNTPTVYAVICIIFGIAFLAVPDSVLDVMFITSGVFIIVLSLIKVLVDIDRNAYGPLRFIMILQDALFIMFGISLIASKSNSASFICEIMGIYTVIRSFIKLTNLSKIQREYHNANWWCDVILSIGLIGLGIWLWFSPTWPKILAGIALLVIGIDLLLQNGLPKIRANRKKNGNGNDFYTDDFEDKT